MIQDYLILFEDCKVVDGYFQSIIYDLSRPSNSNKIPLSLSNILPEFKNNTVQNVIQKYPNETEIIEDYLEFIINNEFGIIGDLHLKQHLAPMNKKVEEPEKIENSILLITNSNFEIVIEFIQHLKDNLCSRLEIRIQDLAVDKFRILCLLFSDSVFKTISLHSIFISERDNKLIETFINNENRVLDHTVYGSPLTEQKCKTNYISDFVNFVSDCGNIRQENFSINRESFFINQKHNSCLYKKLSINFDGNICNCPSMQKKSLHAIISHLDTFINSADYKKSANISKDEIEVCKDCEFRYMCLDCRVFTDSSIRNNSRPSKCNYNPYIAKWSNEEGYKTLAECGVISNESEFSIDHNQIARVNKEIWK